jgi:hypothetical protein
VFQPGVFYASQAPGNAAQCSIVAGLNARPAFFYDALRRLVINLSRHIIKDEGDTMVVMTMRVPDRLAPKLHRMNKRMSANVPATLRRLVTERAV